MLVEEGKLRLDDPVRRYAPKIEFTNRWESTDPVCLVHLLGHTTSWDDLALREFAHNDPTPISLRDALALSSGLTKFALALRQRNVLLQQRTSRRGLYCREDYRHASSLRGTASFRATAYVTPS